MPAPFRSPVLEEKSCSRKRRRASCAILIVSLFFFPQLFTDPFKFHADLFVALAAVAKSSVNRSKNLRKRSRSRELFLDRVLNEAHQILSAFGGASLQSLFEFRRYRDTQGHTMLQLCGTSPFYPIRTAL